MSYKKVEAETNPHGVQRDLCLIRQKQFFIASGAHVVWQLSHRIDWAYKPACIALFFSLPLFATSVQRKSQYKTDPEAGQTH